MTGGTSLACHGIAFRRGQALVLDDVSLSIAPGEVVGAGKSTLLRIMLGLLTPDAGTVTLDGRALGSHGRRQIAAAIAYVPQSHVATFPYSVRQIVAMGRVPHAGLALALGARDNEAIDAALARLRIGHLAQRSYTALSGGERQRVLLARALAQQARFLVMDEPLTGLDFGHQLRLLALLAELAADGYAILNTTHMPEQALSGATRAVLLEQGRVLADGPPRDVITAATMNAFYDISLQQIDVGRHRFFVPLGQ